jgi:hypothetical protein
LCRGDNSASNREKHEVRFAAFLWDGVGMAMETGTLCLLGT